MSDLVMISEPIPGVRQVTLHRPDAMNTLNTELVVPFTTPSAGSPSTDRRGWWS